MLRPSQHNRLSTATRTSTLHRRGLSRGDLLPLRFPRDYKTFFFTRKCDLLLFTQHFWFRSDIVTLLLHKVYKMQKLVTLTRCVCWGGRGEGVGRLSRRLTVCVERIKIRTHPDAINKSLIKSLSSQNQNDIWCPPICSFVLQIYDTVVFTLNSPLPLPLGIIWPYEWGWGGDI